MVLMSLFHVYPSVVSKGRGISMCRSICLGYRKHKSHDIMIATSMLLAFLKW